MKSSVTTSVAAAVVLAAMYMPWRQMSGDLTFMGMSLPKGEGMPFGQPVLTITGWNGHISLFGMEWPNWITLVAASILAIWSANEALIGRRAGAWLLAIFGLTYCLGTALILLTREGGKLGIGVLVVAIAFVVIIVQLARSRKTLDGQVITLAGADV